MAFQTSPGVRVTEIDLTTVVPGISTTVGGFAGVFKWGPIGERVLISSELDLVARFGKPTNHNAETFFTAASFLSYGSALYVTRAANTTTSNGEVGVLTAYAAEVPGDINANTELTSFIVKNKDHYDSIVSFDPAVQYVAKYAGALGNSLKISICDTPDAYQSTIDLKNAAGVAGAGANTTNTAATGMIFLVGSNTALVRVANNTSEVSANTSAAAAAFRDKLSVGDYVVAGNTTVGKQYMKITAISNVAEVGVTGVQQFTVSFAQKYNLSQDVTISQVPRLWEHYNVVDSAPGQTITAIEAGVANNDALHVVVLDEDGAFTGVKNSVLEVWPNLSRATDAKTEDGATNYYKNVLNDRSAYVWYANDATGAESAPIATLANSSNVKPLNISFIDGADGADEDSAAVSDILVAYDQYVSAEDVDVSFIMAGKARGGDHGEQIANYIIDNIAEVRKDLVVFVSPARGDVVNNTGREADDIVTFRRSLRSSSYALLDSGYKYMYDKYNDVYRYVPLNGDMAGIAVRSDEQNDPWYSPAGFNRGVVKNLVKLAFNPNQAARDLLYKNDINPVVTFPGQGTILYGDKTLLGRPSAFDRFNVRRLFIVLEKTISIAARSSLFEFNDEFTRNQFKGLVESFLLDVQGRRGITDFKVVCDSTNNTAEVIDRNEFVGDIYIKPAKSINFIQLNFVAVRSGVEFTEIVGRV